MHYSLGQILIILRDLVEASKLQSREASNSFIEEHPWSGKYLRYFEESAILSRIAANPKNKVEQIQPTAQELREWIKLRRRPCVRFKISAPAPDDKEVLILAFEASDEGVYEYADR